MRRWQIKTAVEFQKRRLCICHHSVHPSGGELGDSRRSSAAHRMQHFEPKPNSTVDRNITPVLLAYARLYCFAHLRLIEPLEALTLNKLHKKLTNFKLYTKRVGDIIEVAICVLKYRSAEQKRQWNYQRPKEITR